ncbi:MAG TPA: MFS transporter [Gaiellaceae bacterium]|nr:MFS transporter [Gaiellaceae bacterium]
MRYRWAVLAAGTAAQASSAATFAIGLPVLAPALREEYALSLHEIGIVLAAAWVGSMVTLLPWGLAADRFGERVVLVSGLAGCAAFLAATAYARDVVSLVALLALAGAAGSSVNSASGRAVMHWFGPDERGLALGIRQTAIPLGGLVAALCVPPLAGAGGSELAFLFLAGLCAAGALVAALVFRESEVVDGVEAATVLATLRDARLWRLCLGSSIFIYAQVAVIGFGVLFLHDEHGFSENRAALFLVGAQVLAVVLRVGAGRWSDVVGSRVGPLRLVGLVVAGSLLATGVLTDGPVWLLLVVLALAGGLSMGWNGLAFAAAAELAGARRSGAAIGFQQTVLSGYGVAAPVLFAATVSATSWTVAFLLAAVFPLAGWLSLRPLREH